MSMPNLPPGTTRLTVAQWRQRYKVTDQDEFMDMLGEMVNEGMAEALCTEGCEVEPDGTCPHGNPSILLAYGIL